jgi:hypothetical protein
MEIIGVLVKPESNSKKIIPLPAFSSWSNDWS